MIMVPFLQHLEYNGTRCRRVWIWGGTPGLRIVFELLRDRVRWWSAVRGIAMLVRRVRIQMDSLADSAQAMYPESVVA